MSRREKLWKAAEGRAFRWWDVAVAVIGALLFLSGLYLVLFAQEIDGAMQLVLGILFLGVSVVRHQQLQIEALRELVKQIDRGEP